MSTKQELNDQLATLAALQAKLFTTTFTEEEQELLAELLATEQTRQTRVWLGERAEQAINLMFPVWRGSRIEKPKHPMWHEKSWWWNGASIESLEEHADGDMTAELSSYVGCGDTETIRLVLKREWLEADDMPAVIQAYCLQEAASREAKRNAQERSRAQAELASAQARLAQLGG